MARPVMIVSHYPDGGIDIDSMSSEEIRRYMSWVGQQVEDVS